MAKPEERCTCMHQHWEHFKQTRACGVNGCDCINFVADAFLRAPEDLNEVIRRLFALQEKLAVQSGEIRPEDQAEFDVLWAYVKPMFDAIAAWGAEVARIMGEALTELGRQMAPIMEAYERELRSQEADAWRRATEPGRVVFREPPAGTTQFDIAEVNQEIRNGLQMSISPRSDAELAALVDQSLIARRRGGGIRG